MTGTNKIITYWLIDEKKELLIDHKELIEIKIIKNKIAFMTSLSCNFLVFTLVFFWNKSNNKKNIKIIELTVLEMLIKKANVNSKMLAKEIEIWFLFSKSNKIFL